VKHRFNNTHGDGADATQTQASHWNSPHGYGLNPLTAAATIDNTYDFVPCDATTAAFTVTLPTAVSNDGLTFTFMKTDSGANAVTIDANSTETINGDLTYLLKNQFDVLQIMAKGGNWLIVDLRTGYSLASQTYVTTTGGGTYTTPAGVKAILVECYGGGGGGGSCDGAASSAGAGGGGGAGGYCRKLILAPASSYAINVGVGGTGPAGAANGTVGGNGGNTTFGTSLLTANGGTGGAASGTAGSTVIEAAGGAGGTATGGDLNVTGGRGGAGVRFSGTQSFSGYGADAPVGAGGSTVMNLAGNAATGFAAGGGAGSTQGATDRAGGAGAQGIIIVTEYK
jgi:hypothetical protein